MIPIIGFIVASYTIPRLFEMVMDDEQNALTKIVTGIGLLGTIILCVLLFTSSLGTAQNLQQGLSGF